MVLGTYIIRKPVHDGDRKDINKKRRKIMEPKNMNGFCELTREEATEIDGGYDRTRRNHNRLTGSRKSAASAQWTATGWAVSAIGVALAGRSGIIGFNEVRTTKMIFG